MKDQGTKEKFVELRAKGWSFGKIARELKVSKQTLVSWSKDLSLEIANLRAIELDALQEEFFLAKEKRIRLFGENLQAIKGELATRKLKEVSTERLFDLLLKYSAALKQESVEPVFQEETDSTEAMLRDSLRTVTSWKA